MADKGGRAKAKSPAAAVRAKGRKSAGPPSPRTRGPESSGAPDRTPSRPTSSPCRGDSALGLSSLLDRIRTIEIIGESVRGDCR
jgi:hypothetical protein